MSALPVSRVMGSVIASMIAFSLWKGFQYVWYQSPLQRLKGPKGTSFLLGNLNELIDDENGELAGRWVKEYGETFRFKGFFNRNHLYTLDTRAINHVLTHSNDYQKLPVVRQGLAEFFGEGVLLVEGTQHQQQRRILNPAFGPAQIRGLTNIFIDKASHLRNLLYSEISKNRTAAGTRIDIIPWLNRAALDVIGLAGFNYSFDSLDPNGQPDELGEAFSVTFSASQSLDILNIILRKLVPALDLIPSAASRKIRDAKNTMMRIGNELLKNAKSTAMASETGKRDMESDALRGRDLLTLLVKANIATDIPDSQKLSDKDVVAQVATFLFAGHETISTSVTWALYAITQAPEVQTKLRDELLSVETEAPSMDELMALPYLDAVVKETLRVHPPIPGVGRIAMKNDILPVEKPYVDRYGAVRDTITIAKGDQVSIPILSVNRSEQLWGPDACSFRPERWNDTPEAVSRIPGVWAHLMTFIGGPRACIGYRFALVEIKMILFSLVRAFEIELAVPASEIKPKLTLAQRPVLRSDPTHEVQLPLLIRPYQRAEL